MSPDKNNPTVNPAGSPKVTYERREVYGRDDFFRDLKKVAERQAPKEEPSRSGSEKR